MLADLTRAIARHYSCNTGCISIFPLDYRFWDNCFQSE